MAQKHSVSELMAMANIADPKGLADRSGISRPTAQRAINGDPAKRINTTSASRIAAALDVTVGDMNLPGGAANVGRPAGTGKNQAP